MNSFKFLFLLNATEAAFGYLSNKEIFEQLEMCRKPVQTCKLICSLLQQKSNKDKHIAEVGLGTLSMHTKNDADIILKNAKGACFACRKDIFKIEHHCLQKLFNNDFFWSK